MVVPNQVTGLKATALNAAVFLTWDIPNDNGDPITDYKTEFKLASAGSFTTFDNGTVPIPSTEVNNLDNDVIYDFRVSAIIFEVGLACAPRFHFLGASFLVIFRGN